MPRPPAETELRPDTPFALGEGATMGVLVVAVPAIFLLDYLSGSRFAAHLLYALPIALAASNLGARAGFVMAGVATLASAAVALLAGEPGQDAGALSRREFDHLLDAEVRRARRYRRPVAVMLFDFPEGKGEPAGFLPAAVRAMLALLREGDSVARHAPRRFAVLLVECPGTEAMQVVSRLRETLLATLRIRPSAVAIGVASYGGALPATAADLMALAESHVIVARSGSGVAETRVD
jgi:GGDEF domain-containing protein